MPKSKFKLYVFINLYAYSLYNLLLNDVIHKIFDLYNLLKIISIIYI